MHIKGAALFKIFLFKKRTGQGKLPYELQMCGHTFSANLSLENILFFRHEYFL